MIGAFPPPVHGMSVINRAMHDLLRSSERTVEVINLSAGTLDRGFRYHMTRGCRAAWGVVRCLISRDRGSSVYISLSGGWGQLYEFPLLLLSRALHRGVTIHHHSYAYLSRRRPLTALLFRAAPRDTLHVVLSNGMRDHLQSLYAAPRALVLSNSAFLSTADSFEISSGWRGVVGFLSNISEEKGVLDFVELADECATRGLDFKFVLAGPFQDARIERHVRELLESRNYVEYVGPVYGAAKADFFRSIDALVFPTRYVNEAEPVTIHEALMHGAPVIAFKRGAIAEIIPDGCGAVVPVDENFVQSATTVLAHWSRLGEGYVDLRRGVAAQFRTSQSRATKALSELLALI